MTDHEIKIAVSEALKIAGPTPDGENFLAIKRDSVILLKNNKSVDCNVEFIRLTGEQVTDGFKPRGWKAIVRKILKIQESMM